MFSETRTLTLSRKRVLCVLYVCALVSGLRFSAAGSTAQHARTKGASVASVGVSVCLSSVPRARSGAATKLTDNGHRVIRGAGRWTTSRLP